MATIRKLDSGKWQFVVRRVGHKPASKTFSTRIDGERWARQLEVDMDRGAYIPASSITLGTLIDRYVAEVSPLKKSCKNDIHRLHYLKAHFGKVAVSSLRSSHVASWRDKRLQEGKAAGTVIKEINSLSHLIEVAMKDWGVGLPSNVVKMVRKPKQAKGRDRRLYAGELDAIFHATQSTVLVPIIHVALETAMRMGEIVKLRWEDIDYKRSIAKLNDTKNGDDRLIPLSLKALATLKNIPRNKLRGPIFELTAHAVSVAFRRSVKRARQAYEASCVAGNVKSDPCFLVDLHFHDLRHEAVSRLFEKGLNVMETASVSGHRTLQMLKRYTHLNAEQLVSKLG